MLEGRSRFVVLLAVCLSALSPACKSADAPPPVGSVKKLGGAPARVLKIAFAGDGKSVLALERRSTEAGSFGLDDKFVVTRRGVAGGESSDVFVSKKEIADFAVLGQKVLVLERRRWPPPLPEASGESKERKELRKLLEAKRAQAMAEMSIAMSGGDDADQLPDEETRCFHLVGAPGGQFVAFSIANEKQRKDAPDDAIVRVIGVKKGEDYRLTRTGIVYDITPDGGRVLISQKLPPSSPEGAAFGLPAPIFDSTIVTLVDVREANTMPLPTAITVDGAEIKTGKLAVNLAGEGLVFRSPEGDVYRCALDGSKAVRVAGALSAAGSAAGDKTAAGGTATSTASGAPAAGSGAAPSASAGSGAVAGTSDGPIRLIDSRGAVLDVRDEGGAVEVSRPAVDKEHPKAEVARLEGTLAGLGPMAIEPSGGQIAFAVVSDTSRDGVLDRVDDDAVVFVSDPAKGSLGLERTKTALLSEELRPKIASALALAPEQVGIVHAGRKLEVTADLPWIAGEKAAALVERWMVAARALAPILSGTRPSVKLRVGPFDAHLATQEEGGTRPYSAVFVLGMVFRDPAALPLVLHDPTLTTIPSGSYPRTLSGIFENTGTTPIGPVEIVVTAKPFSGSADDLAASRRKRVQRVFGPIEPGKKLPYKITIWEEVHGPEFDVEYNVDGKPITPLNALNRGDGLDMLDIALGMYSEQKAVLQNDFANTFDLSIVRVKLGESHVTMAEAARMAALEKMQRAIAGHFRKYHPEDRQTLMFHSPAGGGWVSDNGQKPARFEVDKTMERP